MSDAPIRNLSLRNLSRRNRSLGGLYPVSNSAQADVAVPKWVPKEMRVEYREMAKLYGEEGAASHVRRMKRDAEKGL